LAKAYVFRMFVYVGASSKYCAKLVIKCSGSSAMTEAIK
jgi:hypothetical protein